MLTAACLFFSQANASDQKEDIDKPFSSSTLVVASNRHTQLPKDEQTIKNEIGEVKISIQITENRIQNPSKFDSLESLNRCLQKDKTELRRLERALEDINSQKVEYIKDCPQDTLTETLYWLPAKDVFYFARTSKYYYGLICNDETSIYTKTSLENLLTLDQDQFISVSPSPFNHINIFIGQITNIDKSFFSYFSNYEKTLPHLKKISFKDEMMTSLNLSNMNLGNLKIIEKIVWPQKLKVLNLKLNNLGGSEIDLSSLLTLFPNLKKLYLPENNLGALGDSFTKIQWPQKLKVLNLKLNNLGALGDNFTKIQWPRNLRVLYLPENNLGALGDNFTKIQWPRNLRVLDLPENNLGALGKSFANIHWHKNLEQLYLPENNLGALGDNFTKIQWPRNLEVLYLGYNNLGAIGKSFANIQWHQNLIVLHLKNNNLGAIGESFANIHWPQNLKELNLQDNNLEALEKRLSNRWPNLKILF